MDKLEKIVIGIGATLALSLFGLMGVLGVDSYKYAVRQRMQERQDSIVAMMNYNPLTRVSDVKEYQTIYKETERSVDQGLRMGRF